MNAAQVITTVDGPASVCLADIDHDGMPDILSASTNDNRIAWVRNTGSGTTWTLTTISSSAAGACAVAAGDIDRNGKMDVVAGSSGDHRVVWHKNTAGNGSAWLETTITTDTQGAIALAVADINRDRKLDVVSASADDGRIVWHQNTAGDGSAWTATTIDTSQTGACAVALADINRNGSPDIMAAVHDSDSIVWYDNSGTSPTTFTKRTITTAANGVQAAILADVDRDGDMDVVAACANDNKIAWYENVGGAGLSWTEHVITTTAIDARGLCASDVDGDGDPDICVAVAGDNTVAWHENMNGSGGSWTAHTLSTSAAQACAVAAADFNRDGQIDIVAASLGDDTIAWYRNTKIHSSATWPTSAVMCATTDGAKHPLVADMDKNGALDVMDVENWMEQLNMHLNNGANPPSFANSMIYASNLSSIYAMAIGDINGDGNQDVVAANYSNIYAVISNGAATPGFTRSTIYTSSYFDPEAMQIADMDSDGDMDIVVLPYPGSTKTELFWLENTNGLGTAWTKRSIATNVDGGKGLAIADINNDGNLDIITGTQNPYYTHINLVAWYENSGAKPATFTQRAISTTGSIYPFSVQAADIDRDGDLDVVVGARYEGEVSWYENTSGSGTAWTQHIVSTGIYITHVRVSDADNDGDPDIMATSKDYNQVVFLENTSGNGSAWAASQVPLTNSAPFDVTPADMDRDGKPDLVVPYYSSSSPLALMSNRGGQYALATTGIAPVNTANGDDAALLKIQAAHRGRAGDSDEQLSAFAFKLEDTNGVALTSEQANAMIDQVYVCLDDGSGEYEPANDAVVATTDTLTLAGGQFMMRFADGDARARVALGTPRTYFVLVKLTADADSHTPRPIRVTHLPLSSVARDAVLTSQLQPEYAANTMALLNPGVPDPDVLDGAIPIADGGTVDFGAALFNAPPSKTLTLRNNGTATLYLGAVTLPAAYTLTEGLPASIAPGASDTFTITLDQGTLGTFSQALTIAFTNPMGSENPYHVNLTGKLTPLTQFPTTINYNDTSGAQASPTTNIWGRTGGYALCPATAVGDFNGDGYDDAVKAEYDIAAGGHTSCGEVTIIYGGPLMAKVYDTRQPVGSLGETRIYGPSSSAMFGYSLATGDINGDGIDDLLIGAAYYSGKRGFVTVIYGRPGLNTTPVIDLFTSGAITAEHETRIIGAAANDETGFRITAGDVNGDGFDDAIVGGYKADVNSMTDPGAVYVIYGSASRPGQTLDLSGAAGSCGETRIHGGIANGRLGISVAAGDVNGDGFTDMVIGANQTDINGVYAGNAYIIYGRRDLASTPVVNLQNPAGTYGETRINGAGLSESGMCVACGDVSGDGYADAIIAAPGTSRSSSSYVGEIHVLYGRKVMPGSLTLSDAPATNGSTMIQATSFNTYLSLYMAAIDVNQDGIDDLLASSEKSSGQVFGIFGAGTLPGRSIDVTQANLLIDAASNNEDYFGRGISARIGDINGDGYGDFVIAGIGYTLPDGLSGAGKVVAFFGPASQGPSSDGQFTRTGDGSGGDVVPANDFGPNIRCRIDFSDNDAASNGSGGASMTTATLMRVLPTLNLTSGTRAATSCWTVRTDRTGWANARLTLHYTDAEIAGMNEANLAIYTTSVPYGAFTELPSQIDVALNDISTTITAGGCFIIAETGGVNGLDAGAAVLDGATPIVNGDPTPIDLGSTLIGSAPLSRAFTVFNTGSESLLTGDLLVPAGYQIGNALAASIASGTSDTLTVQLPTMTPGTFSGAVSFGCNDPANALFTWNVTGRILAGDITASPTALAFGSMDVALGATPAQSVTITNSGDADLHIASVSLAGTNASEFAITTDTLQTMLAPAGSRTVQIAFDPATAGAKTAQLQITSDDYDEGTVNVSLTGTAISFPEADLYLDSTPIAVGGGPIDFGTGVYNGTALMKTFTLYNHGTGPLVISGLTQPTGYTISEGLSGPIPAGGSDTFTLTLPTTVPGTFAGTVTITSDDADEGSYTFSITGHILAGEVQVSPMSLAFGNMNIALGATPAQAVTITNLGDSDLHISGVSLAGTNAVDFVITTDTLQTTLAPESSRTVQVAFDPATAGAKTAQLRITSDDYDEATVNVSLTGGGILAPEADLYLGGTPIPNGSTIDFGATDRNGASISKTFTLYNHGSDTLYPGWWTGLQRYALTEGFSSWIVAGGSDTFTITMPTGTPGTITESFSFGTNDSDEGTYTINLTGRVRCADIDASPTTTRVFGNMDIAKGTTASQTVKIKNVGDADLHITTVTLSGTYRSEFVITTDTLQATLTPGSTRTVKVAFDPSSTGSKAAQLRITSDDYDEATVTINLTGTGTAVPEADLYLGSTPIPVGGGPIDFGIAEYNGTALTKTFTLYNTGSGALTVSGVTRPTGYTLTEGLSSSIAAGGSDTFTLTLPATTPGTYAGTVTITSNDADEGSYTFLITGRVLNASDMIWVDFLWSGTEIGTQLQPYNTVAEGVAAVSTGGTVRVKAGVNSGAIRITKPLRLESSGGTASIGK